MLQRFILVIRLCWNPAEQNWRGELEMVNPHRVAVFRNRRELWALLDDWIAQPVTEASAGKDEATIQT
jgi:hypothetical protein